MKNIRRARSGAVLTLVFLILACLLSFYQTAGADCQGCCSGHGGVCCKNGLTQCCDDTPLSDACKNKQCDTCAIFQDVPTDHWAYDSIQKLYNAGITKGCETDKFCPDESVTRAQMAAFLVRAVHSSAFVPPEAIGIFDDVSVEYWAADWIEQLYNDGTTKGCKSDPLLYCPEGLVTRAEMAVFLLRAKHGSGYKPPVAFGIFSDIPSGYWAIDWIEELYHEGITTGCQADPLEFCPETTVSRAQMATFIARTFDIQESATLKIASWNIENFGKTKCSDPVRMAKIAQIIANFDLVAIQEISNIKEQNDPGCPRNEDACPDDPNCGLIAKALQQYLNDSYGLSYQFVFSPQVKDERYLYIYNPSKVALKSAELVADSTDSLPICDSNPISTGLMVRQPFKGYFKAGSFDFILLTTHTSPSVNLTELDGLESFYRQTMAEGEPDVIILGDLNADCSYLKPTDAIALRSSDYIWVIDDDTDTTSGQTNCAYDRIIFEVPTSEDFTGQWGVFQDIQDEISDHYLIWAEFYTTKDSD